VGLGLGYSGTMTDIDLRRIALSVSAIAAFLPR
jgi:hypothetical protein